MAAKRRKSGCRITASRSPRCIVIMLVNVMWWVFSSRCCCCLLARSLTSVIVTVPSTPSNRPKSRWRVSEEARLISSRSIQAPDLMALTRTPSVNVKASPDSAAVRWRCTLNVSFSNNNVSRSRLALLILYIFSLTHLELLGRDCKFLPAED